jgi:polysaccharide biosynthesis protein PelD
MKFEKNFSIAYFKKRSAVWGILETILFTLVLLLIVIKIRPSDPFGMFGVIPWIAMAPILCGLLYGALNGVISLIILLTYLMFQQHLYGSDSYALREYIVGLTSVTLFIGIFSSYWLARIRHVEYLNGYVREHLDDLSRDYYLLRISHERLEHAYITKPLSFRDAFYQIKKEILKNNGEINTAISQQLLNIFSQYCSINCAIFCLYDEKTQEVTTMASLGKEFFLSLTDPLISSALQNRITTYCAVNMLDNEVSEYLAVIPLLDAKQKIIGFIIIKEMPFWSLTHDNLEVLSVFAATFALQFSTIKRVEHLIEIYPDCPPEFLSEFNTLVNLKKYNKVDSGISGLLVPESFFQENIIYSLEQQKRSLDHIWIISLESSKLFITLMPLTSIEGIYGYRKRLTDWLKSEFGQEINRKGMNFRYQKVNDQPVDKQLNEFIQEFSHVDL